MDLINDWTVVNSEPEPFTKSPLPSVAVENVNEVPFFESYLALLPSVKWTLPIFGNP